MSNGRHLIQRKACKYWNNFSHGFPTTSLRLRLYFTYCKLLQGNRCHKAGPLQTKGHWQMWPCTMSGKTASPSALDAFECKSSFEFFITSYNHNARANLFTTPGANVYAVSPYIYIYTHITSPKSHAILLEQTKRSMASKKHYNFRTQLGLPDNQQTQQLLSLFAQCKMHGTDRVPVQCKMLA